MWKSTTSNMYQVQTRSRFNGVICWSKQLDSKKVKVTSQLVPAFPLLIKRSSQRRKENQPIKSHAGNSQNENSYGSPGTSTTRQLNSSSPKKPLKESNVRQGSRISNQNLVNGYGTSKQPIIDRKGKAEKKALKKAQLLWKKKNLVKKCNSKKKKEKPKHKLILDQPKRSSTKNSIDAVAGPLGETFQPVGYSQIAMEALKDNPEGRTVGQIYLWISNRYPDYFNMKNEQWKRCVHNVLTANPYFQKYKGKDGGRPFIWKYHAPEEEIRTPQDKSGATRPRHVTRKYVHSAAFLMKQRLRRMNKSSANSTDAAPIKAQETGAELNIMASKMIQEDSSKDLNNNESDEQPYFNESNVLDEFNEQEEVHVCYSTSEIPIQVALGLEPGVDLETTRSEVSLASPTANCMENFTYDIEPEPMYEQLSNPCQSLDTFDYHENEFVEEPNIFDFFEDIQPSGVSLNNNDLITYYSDITDADMEDILSSFDALVND